MSEAHYLLIRTIAKHTYEIKHGTKLCRHLFEAKTMFTAKFRSLEGGGGGGGLVGSMAIFRQALDRRM